MALSLLVTSYQTSPILDSQSIAPDMSLTWPEQHRLATIPFWDSSPIVIIKLELKNDYKCHQSIKSSTCIHSFRMMTLKFSTIVMESVLQ